MYVLCTGYISNAFFAVCVHRVQEKSGIFVFEYNFTTTGSIFLQFAVIITELLV